MISTLSIMKRKILLFVNINDYFIKKHQFIYLSGNQGKKILNTTDHVRHLYGYYDQNDNRFHSSSIVNQFYVSELNEFRKKNPNAASKKVGLDFRKLVDRLVFKFAISLQEYYFK